MFEGAVYEAGNVMPGCIRLGGSRCHGSRGAQVRLCCHGGVPDALIREPAVEKPGMRVVIGSLAGLGGSGTRGLHSTQPATTSTTATLKGALSLSL